MDSSLVTTSLLAVSITFPILATGAVGLRFLARKVKSQELMADDWMIVLSLVMCWFISINTITTAAIGGLNTTTLDPIAAARLFIRCLWIDGFPLGIGLPTIKISILLFYRRIFVTKPFRYSANIMITILVGWSISTCVAQLLAGNPIPAAWNPVAPSLRFNYSQFALAFAGMSIVFDVLILCFPLPVIRNLKMATRRKVTIAGMFWLGAFCCIAAGLRFYFLYQGTFAASSSHSLNRYNNATRGYIWAHIEPNCSIIAACLPCYGPFFTGRARDWRPKVDFTSLRTLFSVGGNSKTSRGGKTGPGSKSFILESLPSTSGTEVHDAWQRLEGADGYGSPGHSFEVAAGMNEGDLEPGWRGMPMKSEVPRGFGAGVSLGYDEGSSKES